MAFAASYRDLVVYQKSRALAKELFEISKRFPPDERFSLTDQGRRSSRSIGAQIAEAWAKRFYERHFVSKLTDADGEQQETQHWVDVAGDCGYLDANTVSDLKKRLSEIGKMLQTMINKADLFCAKGPRVVREDTADYFSTPSRLNTRLRQGYGGQAEH
ncbi:MAG: four helix bundle protein [Verrucomicrobiota bacterium]